MDDDFFDLAKHQVESNSIYMVGRAQFNHNLEKVKDMINDKSIQVILSNPHEGSETLKHHVQRAGLENYALQGKLLLLGGGDMEPNYHYLRYDSFLPKIFDYRENILASQQIEQIYSKLDKPYKFLFLNGRARPNRKYLLHFFQHIGLLDQAIWTNLDTWTGRSQDINLIIDNHDVMSDNFSIKLLDEKYEVDRYRNNLSKDLHNGWIKNNLFDYQGNLEWGEIYLNAAPYVDTYFSVVTETIYTYPYSFRTEKIWKPIAMGHPFIAVANQGYYRDLHNLGFKTFGNIIDETFDSIEDNLTRLERTRDVIINLCNSDLNSFLAEAKEICEYNQRHLWYMRDQVRGEFSERFRKFMVAQGVINE